MKSNFSYPWVLRNLRCCTVEQMDNRDNRLARLIIAGWSFLSPSKAKFTSSTCSIISPNSWVSISVDVGSNDIETDRIPFEIFGSSNSLLPFLGFFNLRMIMFLSDDTTGTLGGIIDKEFWEEFKLYSSASKVQWVESWDEYAILHSSLGLSWDKESLKVVSSNPSLKSESE